MNKLSKSTPASIKIMNRELIINKLKNKPKQSRANLSQSTGLSKPTVSSIVKELIKEGLIFEVGEGTSTGGKRPVNLVYNPDYNYVVGIAIENNIIYFSLGNMNGELISIFSKKIENPEKSELVLSVIIDGIFELLKNTKVDEEKIIGIVIGVPGIKQDSDNLIRSSPTIHWGGINLKKEIKEKLGKEVIIENDVNLMTIGEHYKGQAKNINDFVYLFIGNGIGSGIFLNGKFIKGFHSAAGEIGYMMIGDKENLKQNTGVFEKNYGLLGVIEKLKKLNIQLNYKDSDSLLEILQKNKKNKMVKEILDDTITHWAEATINIISVIDPETVILSGELLNMEKTSLNSFKEFVYNHAPQGTKLKKAKLGFQAGIYGAFHLGLDYFHKEGFQNSKQ